MTIAIPFETAVSAPSGCGINFTPLRSNRNASMWIQIWMMKQYTGRRKSW